MAGRPNPNKRLDATGFLRFAPDLRQVSFRANQVAGQFTSMQYDIVEAHKEMAAEAAQDVAYALQESIKERPGGARPQRGTEYLIRAILNEENRAANSQGFVVGTDYMDRSPARSYYRNLETGTDVFVGREISGFFSNAIGSKQWFGPERDRLNARLIQLGPVFGKHGAQSTISRGTVGKSLRGGHQVNATGPYRIIIRNPIEPYEYFLLGGERWLERDNAAAIYERVLGKKYPLSFQ